MAMVAIKQLCALLDPSSVPSVNLVQFMCVFIFNNNHKILKEIKNGMEEKKIVNWAGGNDRSWAANWKSTMFAQS